MQKIRKGRILGGIGVLSLCVSMGAYGGTAIKINSASVSADASLLTLEGANFPTDGTLEIYIGDTSLSDCTVLAARASCSIANTPASSGGSWNVSLSAGNSPNSNAAIDVYVPSGQAAACQPGDYVSCYPGDQTELGVGMCRAGTRTCQSSGSYGSCAGAVIPTTEYPDQCDDGLDNDCDGRIDNGCDVLTENPTVFTKSATFSLPPGVTQVDIVVWGPGAKGQPGSTSNGSGGAGGGSGGLGYLEGYSFEEGAQFAVNMTSTRSAVKMNDVEIVMAESGTGSSGGSGSSLGGNDGQQGQACVLPASGGGSCTGAGGQGGSPLAYLSRAAGGGGYGGSGSCSKSCWEECSFVGCVTKCVTTCNASQGAAGAPGLVQVSWRDETP